MYLSDFTGKIILEELYPEAFQVVSALRENGFKAYFVGGCVRDLLLGIPPSDIDVATTAIPEKISGIFPKSYDIGAKFGIVNVIVGTKSFEVATLRREDDYTDGRRPDKVVYTDDPETDALRRDFTINGLFLDPFSGEILDFAGGIDDLRKGIVRTIGDPFLRFSEDYLRMLRAVRFASRFSYLIAPETVEAIKSLKKNVLSLSSERIRDELNKMFSVKSAEKAFRTLSEFGLMKLILPEIEALKGVEQHHIYHPEGDVFEHTALMLRNMDEPGAELAWSIILHDVGKTATQTFDDAGVSHFYRHEKKSAEIGAMILKRLKFSNDFTETVLQCVENHMTFAHVQSMRPGKLKRFMAGDEFQLELELHRIDCKASHGKLDNYKYLLDKLAEIENETALPEPFLRGSDLIAVGLRPGPVFGKIISESMDLQLDGILKTKEEALDWLEIKLEKESSI